MPLHPQASEFLRQHYLVSPASRDDVPLDDTRSALLRTAVIPPDCPVPARTVDQVLNGRCGEFRVRVHTPRGSGPFGGCLYFHGGGWVLGSIETHDDLVRRLVEESGCVLVSVDYPLAPEFPYPTAVEDSYLALEWVARHAQELQIDPRRLAVAGDSAGGNLAAVLCLMSRDRQGPPIARQVLLYPITDCDFERPSYLQNAEGYFLCLRDMRWFWRHYTGMSDRMTEPYVSPLRAASHAGLPPALVITAEFDPLRDEGVAYAHALEAAGVPTMHHEYPGMIHGFVKRWNLFDDARIATREIGAFLQYISP